MAAYLKLCTLVFLGLVMAGCGEDAPAQKDQPVKQARTANVSVYAIHPDSLVQYSRLPATVKAWRDVTISALETGVVMALRKDIGDTVREGEELAKLNLEVLEAAALEAEANLKFQTYNFEHSKKLFKEGSISEQADRAAEYDYNRAKSAAETIRRRLSYGEIRAPFSGQLAQRFIDLGQLVSPGAPTFRLVQTGRLRVEAWVPESQIADFAEGNPVTFSLDAFPDETFSGTIGHIGPAAQSDQRVFPLEVHLPNPDGRIRPGMIGKIIAVRQTFRKVVVIPREAVVERENGPAAFVVNDDVAHLRTLQLGPAEGDRVVVRDGLTFGDQLVVKGGRDLIDGDHVQITHMEPAQ